MTEEIDMNLFRGLVIMLLAIIAFMIIDGLLNVPYITMPLALTSGLVIMLTCNKLDPKNLNTFRATFVMGIIFFMVGNYLIMSNKDLYYQSVNSAYAVTMGFFLTAIGVIIGLSSIPIIIYKDVKARSSSTNTSY